MPPLQAESVWVSNDSMDQDQHARAENLHPEPQSYSDDLGLGAGPRMAGYHAIGQPTFSPLVPDLVGVSYPLRNTWALNNTHVPSVQVSGPFQYGQIPTLTNFNDHYLNIYGPWQPTPVLPSCYALEEAGLLASSTGVDQSGNTVYEVGNAVPQSGNNIYDVCNAVSQSGNTIYDVGNVVSQSGNNIYDVGNAAPQSGNTIYGVGNAAPQSGNTIYGVGNALPQSYMPLLSQSTFLGLPIDATAEVSIAPPPSNICERNTSRQFPRSPWPNPTYRAQHLPGM